MIIATLLTWTEVTFVYKFIKIILKVIISKSQNFILYFIF